MSYPFDANLNDSEFLRQLGAGALDPKHPGVIDRIFAIANGLADDDDKPEGEATEATDATAVAARLRERLVETTATLLDCEEVDTEELAMLALFHLANVIEQAAKTASMGSFLGGLGGLLGKVMGVDTIKVTKPVEEGTTPKPPAAPADCYARGMEHRFMDDTCETCGASDGPPGVETLAQRAARAARERGNGGTQ